MNIEYDRIFNESLMMKMNLTNLLAKNHPYIGEYHQYFWFDRQKSSLANPMLNLILRKYFKRAY